MTERQLTRATRILIGILVALGAAIVVIAYAPFTIVSFALREYMDVRMSTAHTVATMVALVLAPSVFVWRRARWRSVGLWFLWAAVIAIYALMPIVSATQHDSQPLYTADVMRWYAGMYLCASMMGIVFIILLGVAGCERMVQLPDARVVKR